MAVTQVDPDAEYVYNDILSCCHCGKVYYTERNYMRHKCPQLEKEDKLHTINGQVGYTYFQMWMRAMKRTPPTPEQFLSSAHFNSMVKFVEFSKQVNIPDVGKYIQFVTKRELLPAMWGTNDAYSEYLEHLDRTVPPMDNVQISIKTLVRVANKRDVDVRDVFDAMTPGEVILLLTARQLSPWILLFSKKFKQFVNTKCSTEQQLILRSYINPRYWKEKKEQHSDIVPTITTIVQRMEL